jgi:metallo-beta-lactamase family protein
MGYTGPVYGTPATLDMTGLILRDSARLQVADNERINRKRMRAGEQPEQPLYTSDDAEKILSQLRPVSYQQEFEAVPGMQAIWHDAGHMLGSASIQLIVEEDGTTKRVVFSGDLGPRSAPILREFEPFQQADLVFLESTYGGRDHRSLEETVAEFEQIVIDAVNRGGKMLVPTFAVGRAQLITLLLGKMFRAGKVQPFPIFLDSPMAIEATNIYAKHPELFDEEMTALIHDHPLRDDLKTMRPTPTAEESRAINDVIGACLVMAGAGMCNGGRILHHLRANLWKPSTHVLIVGYQAYGSLGRQLVDGVKEVKIFGEKIAVKATIHTLGGFSAHAGQTDLMHWFDVMAPDKPRVELTHGEDDQRAALARVIQQRHGLSATLPKMGEVIEL